MSNPIFSSSNDKRYFSVPKTIDTFKLSSYPELESLTLDDIKAGIIQVNQFLYKFIIVREKKDSFIVEVSRQIAFPTYIEEIDLEIMLNMTDEQVKNLRETNKYLNRLLKNKEFWRERFYRYLKRHYLQEVKEEITLPVRNDYDTTEKYGKLGFLLRNLFSFIVDNLSNNDKIAFVLVVINEIIQIGSFILFKKVLILIERTIKGKVHDEIIYKSLLLATKYQREQYFNYLVPKIVGPPKHINRLFLEAINFLIPEDLERYSGDPQGLSDAYIVAGDKSVPLFKFLLERGADVHLNNEEALYRAVDGGNYEIVQLLMDYGADPNNNSKIWEIAYLRDDQDMIEILKRNN